MLELTVKTSILKQRQVILNGISKTVGKYRCFKQIYQCLVLS
jgi:hypothetical protein